MSGDVDSAALARYLLGESDRYESEAVRRWIDADPARGHMVAALRDIWQRGAADRPALDVDAFWARLATRLEAAARPMVAPVPLSEPVLEPPSAVTRRGRRWLAIAAVAAAAVLVVMIPRPPRGARSASIGPSRPVAPAHVATRRVATKRGERVHVYLADGTRVILAAESRLEFPLDFGARARDVNLQGQAFFEVVHNEHKPFRVHTATAVVEDLGTDFSVREYPDAAIRVAVSAGRVALAAVQDTPPGGSVRRPLILDAGMVGGFGPGGEAVIDSTASVDTYIAWIAGELRFQRTPLGPVFRELGRWYDLDITLDDPALADRIFTGRFKDQPANAVLRSIALVLDLDIQRVGRTVMVRPRTDQP